MARDKSIDFGTLKTILEMMRPAAVAPIAPIAPLAPLPNSSDVGMARDIQYLTRAIDEVKVSLKDITDNHVTLADAAKHAEDDAKIHASQEKDRNDLWKQMTANTLAIARIQTWGAALFLLVGIAETLLIHYWK